MNKQLAGYWITTGLFCAAMVAGGVADVTQADFVLETFERLGYAPYVAVIIGVWKLLGVAALLAPGRGRLKEWAYAGFVFDLTGAAISHAVVGDGIMDILTPLALLVVMAASYVLRPKSRRI